MLEQTCYRAGDIVSYYSPDLGGWVLASVNSVNADGTVNLSDRRLESYHSPLQVESYRQPVRFTQVLVVIFLKKDEQFCILENVWKSRFISRPRQIKFLPLSSPGCRSPSHSVIGSCQPTTTCDSTIILISDNRDQGTVAFHSSNVASAR